MTLIVCLDDKDGMMFNKRRQSRDREVISDIISQCKSSTVYVNKYTAALFENDNAPVKICDNPFNEAKSNDYVFDENIDAMPYSAQIDKIIIYKWNRIYPSDIKFNIDINGQNYFAITKSEFKGFSHEKITKTVYRKKG